MKAPAAMMETNGAATNPGLKQIEALRICMLGGFRISVGGRPIEDKRCRLRKAWGLFKLLALAPGHRLHRDQVTDLLWPNLNPKAALNNLHYALYAVRQALDPAGDVGCRYLSLRDEQLALSPEGPLWVDVQAFEHAAAAARHTREPTAYRAALGLYSGELLPEDRYEGWAEERRARLRNTYTALLEELASIHEARGEPGAAIDALRRLLEHGPTHEEAHASLIRLFAATGQRYRALCQYERLKEVLEQELGIEPGAATRRLYAEVVSGGVPSAPLPAARPSRPSVFPRHNLPATLTSFIGREREIFEAETLLAGTRLLTLTGAGGTGKTRLALEVARDRLDTHPDEVWLVELASLPEPGLVPQAVAAALGIREQPDRSVTGAVIAALRHKELLLVLDNCEHLVESAAQLTEELLSFCPGLRILATSREVLGVAGEVSRTVPPLSLSVGMESTGGMPEPEAVRLFVDRARCRQPGFELTDKNGWVVREICRKLDGVPLAIELAAARVGTLTAEQISARLDDALSLLTEGGRTAVPRHQTLRATLDWSYELLDERERALFERLSVFAGGWTLEAAEAVATGGDIGERYILDLLFRLTSKSLVVADEPGEGDLRYRMLAPVWQYAREKLEAGGESPMILGQHARWYLEFARRAQRGLIGPDHREWSERLEREHGNLRVALSWAIANNPELGLNLAVSQQLFWHTHGFRGEGQRWLEMAARGCRSNTRAKAEALCVAGHMASYRGDLAAAKTLAEEALSMYRELGDKEGMAHALVVLGFVAALGQDNPEKILALEEEAMSLRPEIEDRRIAAFLLQFSGVAAVSRDDWERAESLHEESLRLFRETSDAVGASVCLINLGLMAFEQGDQERSLRRLRESLRETLEPDREAIMNALSFLAVVTAAGGRPDRAARLWGAAKRMQQTHGMRLLPMPRRRLRHDEHLAAARSQLDEATWEAAWAEGKAMTQREAIEYALSEENSSFAGPPPENRLVRLTRREHQVALLTARGLTNRQISQELAISERTVENHVAHTLRKLGLHSRTQIAAWIVESERPS